MELDAANLEGMENGGDGLAIIDCSAGGGILSWREEVDVGSGSVDDRHLGGRRGREKGWV